MTARLLRGTELAAQLLAAAAGKARDFARSAGRGPFLAAVSATDDAGAKAYWDRIEAFARDGGVETKRFEVAPSQLIESIRRLNDDASIDGILPLAPLPASISNIDVAAVLSPTKDVDGLTPANAGRLMLDIDGLQPCTPRAAVALAMHAIGDLRGVEATVVGASGHVGRPLALLLLRHGATVTVAHADTRDLKAACSHAQLLFVAVGKAALIGADHLQPGMTVIDIGINRGIGPDGKPAIVGDVDFAAARKIVEAISAVPDGVGPLTTAYLIDHTVRAALCTSVDIAENAKGR